MYGMSCGPYFPKNRNTGLLQIIVLLHQPLGTPDGVFITVLVFLSAFFVQEREGVTFHGTADERAFARAENGA